MEAERPLTSIFIIFKKILKNIWVRNWYIFILIPHPVVFGMHNDRQQWTSPSLEVLSGCLLSYGERRVYDRPQSVPREIRAVASADWSTRRTWFHNSGRKSLLSDCSRFPKAGWSFHRFPAHWAAL